MNHRRQCRNPRSRRPIPRSRCTRPSTSAVTVNVEFAIEYSGEISLNMRVASIEEQPCTAMLWDDVDNK